MGKLRSIDRKTSYRNTVWAELVSASVIAIGFMMCALQMFGFSYGLDNAFSGGIGGGMINAWNTAADALGNRDYVILPRFEGASDSCGLFITLCLMAAAAIAFFIVRSGRTWLLLLFIIPPSIMNTVFGLPLGISSYAMLCIGIISGVLIVRKGAEGFLKNIFFVAAVIIVSGTM